MKVKKIEEGIYLAYKPKGITSFQFISKLKKELKVKKIGHAGTLDPQAEGLMIVACDNATKKISKFLKMDKCYQAEILIGVSTDTIDLEGKVLKRTIVEDLDKTIIKNSIENLKGELFVEVPLYSAIKVKGKELYKYARSGQEVDIPKKRMQVLKSEFLGFKKASGNFLVVTNFCVSSGTYIRSLVSEFSKMIGLPATLYSLLRTKIGDFSLDDLNS